MFTDRVKVKMIAGKGGNGVVAWRREKHLPKGGPWGGDGGHGGSLVLQADAQLSSLDWFRNRAILKADNGGAGGPNNRHGKNGKNRVLKVPCGTLIKDAATDEVLHDLTQNGQQVTLCQGGRGGYGNASFKTPTNRAPNTCTLGTLGEMYDVELELKLIADVGLVGFPNAGKSTLFSQLAKTKPKIAAYPFTTLQPNLGFIVLPTDQRVYIADIPGIIENAHQNRGLGLEFLRHIERTKILLYVLDASGIEGRTPSDDFRVLQNEIREYNPELLERPSLVLLNKTDVESAQEHCAEFHKAYPQHTIHEISAKENRGLEAVLAHFCSATLEKICM